VVQERYERLVALQDAVAWDENTRLVGRRVELLAATGEGRKDAATARMSGRARDNRLVHFVPVGAEPTTPVRPGDMVTVEITAAAPHHLVADGPLLAVRRTGAGDAWAARTGATSATAAMSDVARPGVLLGMPRVGLPPV